MLCCVEPWTHSLALEPARLRYQQISRGKSIPEGRGRQSTVQRSGREDARACVDKGYPLHHPRKGDLGHRSKHPHHERRGVVPSQNKLIDHVMMNNGDVK